MVLSNLSKIGRSIAHLTGRIGAFLKDNRGVSTVEYALIVVAVVAVVGAGAVVLSGAFDELFEQLSTDISEGADAMSALTSGGSDSGSDDTSG